MQSDAAMITDYFSEATVFDIVAKLEGATGASQSWALQVAKELREKSPLSLAITDRHIRSARTLDLRETLIQDYRLAVRCLEGHDFREGVRAALIDKTGQPSWQPARLADVTVAMVDTYFAPLGADELRLLTRAEMQASRV